MTENSLSAGGAGSWVDFLDGWQWGRVFGVWRARLEYFSAPLAPLFEAVQVYGDVDACREPELAWWPRRTLASCRDRLQDALRGGLTGAPLAQPPDAGAGHECLEQLWRYRADVEAVAALLLAVSLEKRLCHGGRSYPHGTWPPYVCAQALLQLVRCASPADRVGAELPIFSDDGAVPLTDANALVRYLADEHAALLLRKCPVALLYRAPRTAPRPAPAPRSAIVRLRDLTAAELQVLVWSRSTRSLAVELGVSDVAVAKRCRALEVPKPTRGFWAQVDAGKRPHPHGTPVTRREKSASRAGL